MSDQQLTPQEAALQRLTPNEEIEYRAYVRSGKPDLSVRASLDLYELFVQGLTCAEIAKLNPLLGIGAIMKARVDHRWDERRDLYLADLYANANSRLQQIGAESLNFLSLALAAAHKDQGERMKRYLQSGNPADLGPMQVVSFRTYKEIIETLLKLTGKDQKPNQGSSVNVLVQPGATATVELPGASTPFTPEQADAMRALLGKKP